MLEVLQTSPQIMSSVLMLQFPNPEHSTCLGLVWSPPCICVSVVIPNIECEQLGQHAFSMRLSLPFLFLFAGFFTRFLLLGALFVFLFVRGFRSRAGFFSQVFFSRVRCSREFRRVLFAILLLAIVFPLFVSRISFRGCSFRGEFSAFFFSRGSCRGVLFAFLFPRVLLRVCFVRGVLFAGFISQAFFVPRCLFRGCFVSRVFCSRFLFAF